jgi:hypothetical protein
MSIAISLAAICISITAPILFTSAEECVALDQGTMSFQKKSFKYMITGAAHPRFELPAAVLCECRCDASTFGVVICTS